MRDTDEALGRHDGEVLTRQAVILKLPSCPLKTKAISPNARRCTVGLWGVRLFKRPYIALSTQDKMKHPRHVLSQKVIAGTMYVHPPYMAPMEKSVGAGD